MKFKILEELPREEVDTISTDSAKLGTPVEYEGNAEKLKIEFRMYDVDRDGSIQTLEQQIAAHGVDTNTGTDDDGDEYSSMVLTSVFESPEQIISYLTSKLPIAQVAKQFETNNNYMKIFIYELDKPNQPIDISTELNVGSHTVTDDDDANDLIQALKDE